MLASLLVPISVAGAMLGNTVNMVGSWISPPPPTTASTKPAPNAAAPNTQKSTMIPSFSLQRLYCTEEICASLCRSGMAWSKLGAEIHSPTDAIMTDFAFSTVAHIVSELGAAKRLGEHIAQRFPDARRALLVTDPGFLRTGLVDVPAASLRGGLAVEIYSQVMADPPEAVVLKRWRRPGVPGRYRHRLGGGSSMDVAKLIAVLADSEQPISAIYGIGNVRASGCRWCRFQPPPGPARRSPTSPSSPPALPQRWAWSRLNSMPIWHCWMRN
jgi:hypothetical protein